MVKRDMISSFDESSSLYSIIFSPRISNPSGTAAPPPEGMGLSYSTSRISPRWPAPAAHIIRIPPGRSTRRTSSSGSGANKLVKISAHPSTTGKENMFAAANSREVPTGKSRLTSPVTSSISHDRAASVDCGPRLERTYLFAAACTPYFDASKPIAVTGTPSTRLNVSAILTVCLPSPQPESSKTRSR